MVAIVTVFANHLWGVPSGGFVGVDVFFVISGFLITGNLMRDAENRGTVSFIHFYWNRVRRIVPAAALVLLLTYIAATLVFLPFRAREVGIDGFYAFIFMANWHFALRDTDYFAATEVVSPIQHYWSLSIEEQFYFVWPAIIFAISLIVVRKGWHHERRMHLAAGVMASIITMSLLWALYQTNVAPTWAYFDTFSRVWELGVGALLATIAPALGRIPVQVKPILSWSGLLVIGAALIFIDGNSAGFPAPLAAMPVAGAALVIAAGIETEPRHLGFLQNPVSGYLGDISYSLYLVHWPVIVIVGSMMDGGWQFYVVASTAALGLAIASYHLVENPLRRATWSKVRGVSRELRKRRYQPEASSGYAAIAALTLIAVAMVTYVERPRAYGKETPPPLAAAATQAAPLESDGLWDGLGPLSTGLQAEIREALSATDWPELSPSIESIVGNDPAVSQPGFPGCGGITLIGICSWGSDSAPHRAVIAGNSVALYYVQPLRQIAENSGGQLQIHTEAMPGCNFVSEQIFTEDSTYAEACPGRKQQFVDYVRANKPEVVFISHNYTEKRLQGVDRELSPSEWTDSMNDFIEQFRDSTRKIVILAPPPGDSVIADCYSKRGSTPADCVGNVSSQWLSMSKAEAQLANTIGGTYIDSRPWFCDARSYCPSFVGTTPTKLDRSHMLPAYGDKIFQVIDESLKQAGVFP